ncbi:hypothetical protein [Butyrivibrio sp. JL13D10]|uniref:hypothetical protein n=1 Tax=Butyrivibrio sp. JL13D10 TaxID=3236815 RepID=UPI0038B5D1B5
MSNILIICDNDKNYCKKLDSYIRANLSIPFEIYGITEVERLQSFKEKGKNILLLISQAIFESTNLLGFEHILVLREKERSLEEEEADYGNKEADIRYTDKYQKSERITDNILSMCLDIPGIVVKGKRTDKGKRMKVTGFYTPTRNSDQTKGAIAYTKNLSSKERTLYLNTDPLCIHKIIRNETYEENIIDLMYFAECSEEKFGIYLKRIVKHDDGMSFVPASNSICQSRMITAKEYGRLIEQIDATGDYDNLVIDISEGVCDLFEIINLCDDLFMLLEDDYDAHLRTELFLNELKRDDNFDMNKLHRVSRIGGPEL